MTTGGLDLVPNTKLYKYFRNRSEYAQAAMARTINVGGYWTAQRLCEAGYLESNLCMRCGIGAVDSLARH